MGRLVVTHSTYIDGLIPWLKTLAEADGIKTITPAVIARARGRSNDLVIRLSSKILGGYKLIARKGRSMQEIFVITHLDEVQLIEQINIARKG